MGCNGTCPRAVRVRRIRTRARALAKQGLRCLLPTWTWAVWGVAMWWESRCRGLQRCASARRVRLPRLRRVLAPRGVWVWFVRWRVRRVARCVRKRRGLLRLRSWNSRRRRTPVRRLLLYPAAAPAGRGLWVRRLRCPNSSRDALQRTFLPRQTPPQPPRLPRPRPPLRLWPRRWGTLCASQSREGGSVDEKRRRRRK